MTSLVIVASDASGWEYGMRAGMESYAEPDLPMWFGREVEREIERLKYWLGGSGTTRVETLVSFYTAYGSVLTSSGLNPAASRNAFARVVSSALRFEPDERVRLQSALAVYTTAYRALLQEI